MIHLKNLTKSFGNNHVLKDISATFPSGNVIGIAGANGAGKTTLFRCIAGLETYQGSIESGVPDLKKELGLLTTEPYFFSKITGREYIQLLCNARNIDAGDIDFKNIFELPLDQYASTYSTGMKKKLAITAIVLQQNRYYILDEPFNGVDMHGNLIIDRIIHHLKKAGKTVLLSSHIFSTLRASCDEIYLLREGIFARQADRKNFNDLENELKEFTIGDKIDKLGI